MRTMRGLMIAALTLLPMTIGSMALAQEATESNDDNKPSELDTCQADLEECQSVLKSLDSYVKKMTKDKEEKAKKDKERRDRQKRIKEEAEKARQNHDPKKQKFNPLTGQFEPRLQRLSTATTALARRIDVMQERQDQIEEVVDAHLGDTPKFKASLLAGAIALNEGSKNYAGLLLSARLGLESNQDFYVYLEPDIALNGNNYPFSAGGFVGASWSVGERAWLGIGAGALRQSWNGRLQVEATDTLGRIDLVLTPWKSPIGFVLGLPIGARFDSTGHVSPIIGGTLQLCLHL